MKQKEWRSSEFKNKDISSITACILDRPRHKKIINDLKELKVKIKFLECSEFQMIVWKELLKIKQGTTIFYSEIANLISYPKAIRAVASAVGKNPISVIVPCHRVIRKNGFIGGYVWGVKMKKALLDVEV